MTQRITILIADDDEEDCAFARDALKASRLANDIRFVHDGVALLEYLRREGEYAEPGAAPKPGVILVDLNMPRKSGLEAIAEIKADPTLRHLPLVALTTSRADEDILRSYELGVSSYISKPVSFDALIDVMKHFSQYWLSVVELPR